MCDTHSASNYINPSVRWGLLYTFTHQRTCANPKYAPSADAWDTISKIYPGFSKQPKLQTCPMEYCPSALFAPLQLKKNSLVRMFSSERSLTVDAHSARNGRCLTSCSNFRLLWCALCLELMMSDPPEHLSCLETHPTHTCNNRSSNTWCDYRS